MRLTVLGGCGAWPEPGLACSGYLIEHDGFRLVVDLGYATVPRLPGHVEPGQVDAVYISHGLAASAEYPGPAGIATAGLTLDLAVPA